MLHHFSRVLVLLIAFANIKLAMCEWVREWVSVYMVSVPEFPEVGQDSTGVQIMCDGSTAGHQTGPDVRFYRQTSLGGFLR